MATIGKSVPTLLVHYRVFEIYRRMRDIDGRGGRHMRVRTGDAGILPRLRNLKGGMQNEIEVRVTDRRQRLLSADDVPTVGGLGICREIRIGGNS
jgi:hypothetical protein